MDGWFDYMRSQIRILKQSHKKQRIALELALETDVASNDITGAKYSNELLSYLKKEELMLKGDDINLDTINALSDRINEMIKAETQEYFKKKVSRNMKKW
jgi:hypothetical protein